MDERSTDETAVNRLVKAVKTKKKVQVPRWHLESRTFKGDTMTELWESSTGTLKKTTWTYTSGRKYWKDTL